MTTTLPSRRAAGTALRADWRVWNLAALSALTAYSAGMGWQAQFVSYPLFAQVSAADFPAYHLAYNAAIPGVVIVPGFVSFVAGIAFYWTRPAEVSRTAGVLVAICGLGSILSTVAWAIPMHDRLDRIGQDAATITSLLQANALRTAFLTAGTLVLVGIVGKLLRGRRVRP